MDSYMKIYNLVTYFNEELILKIILNTLYKNANKFTICEGKLDHKDNW